MNGIGNHKRVALDSNLFIYYFEDNPEFAPTIKKIFDKIINGSISAITSVISITETLSYPSPEKVIDGITETFLNFPNIIIMDIDQQIAFEAASIRRKYSFRLPDSIQLATAKLNKAQVFISNDQRLKQFKELKVILLTDV